MKSEMPEAICTPIDILKSSLQVNYFVVINISCASVKMQTE